jgi:hypothetical protein
MSAWRAQRSSRAKIPEPKDDMLDVKGLYPDLKRWIRHYGGYLAIPWDKYDAAMARARERAAQRKILLEELLPRDEPEPEPPQYEHICPVCGLRGPVATPDGFYCRRHREGKP